MRGWNSCQRRTANALPTALESLFRAGKPLRALRVQRGWRRSQYFFIVFCLRMQDEYQKQYTVRPWGLDTTAAPEVFPLTSKQPRPSRNSAQVNTQFDQQFIRPPPRVKPVGRYSVDLHHHRTFSSSTPSRTLMWFETHTHDRP